MDTNITETADKKPDTAEPCEAASAADNSSAPVKKNKKKEVLRFLKYTCVACSAAVVELGSFALLNELLHLDYWMSYLCALVLSILWAFTINRRYTFASNANVPKAMALVFAYYLVFTPTTTWLENFLTVGCGWNEYLVTGINMAINMVTEYLYQRLVVYRRTIDTNDIAQRKSSQAPSGVIGDGSK